MINKINECLASDLEIKITEYENGRDFIYHLILILH